MFPNFRGIAVLLTAVPLFLGCEFCRRQKNFMSEKIDYSKGIYDARQLGAGRMFILMRKKVVCQYRSLGQMKPTKVRK